MRKFYALLALVATIIGSAFAFGDGLTVPFSMPATTCTNQLVRSIAAITGAGTCASIVSTDLASVTKPTICAGFAGAVCPTSGTNATYTTPANVLWVEFFLAGGGGGGGGGNGTATPGTAAGSTCLAASGTACAGSIITATGAVGSAGGSTNAAGAPGACTIGGNVLALTGNPGVLASGVLAFSNGAPGAGAGSFWGGGGLANSNGTAGAGVPNSGGGGAGGDATTASTIGGPGGSSGGYCDHIINSPAASYTYTLAAAGAGQAAGTGGVAGAAGGTGGIRSIEHYGN